MARLLYTVALPLAVEVMEPQPHLCQPWPCPGWSGLSGTRSMQSERVCDCWAHGYPIGLIPWMPGGGEGERPMALRPGTWSLVEGPTGSHATLSRPFSQTHPLGIAVGHPQMPPCLNCSSRTAYVPVLVYGCLAAWEDVGSWPLMGPWTLSHSIQGTRLAGIRWRVSPGGVSRRFPEEGARVSVYSTGPLGLRTAPWGTGACKERNE